jgi:hypothetical protein
MESILIFSIAACSCALGPQDIIIKTNEQQNNERSIFMILVYFNFYEIDSRESSAVSYFLLFIFMNDIHKLRTEVKNRLWKSLLPEADSSKWTPFQKFSFNEPNEDFYYVDEGIRPAVQLLNSYGFETYESCEGGTGHAFDEPTVRFYGNEFDCIRAYEVCQAFGLNILNARRVFRKEPLYNKEETQEIGLKWQKPFNELVFLKHSETGTIFRPR